MSVRACHRGAETRTGAVGGWHHLGTAAQCGEVHAAHCMGQGRQGRQGQNARAPVSECFRQALPNSVLSSTVFSVALLSSRTLVLVRVGLPSALKRRTQTLNFIPTDHIQRHRLPGPKRFEPPVFAFCIRSISQPGYTTQQPTAVGVHGGSV